jgi:hypothetical protein
MQGAPVEWQQQRHGGIWGMWLGWVVDAVDVV